MKSKPPLLNCCLSWGEYKIIKTEKIFTSLRPFVADSHTGKTKFCASCGNLATQEALFSFGGGVTIIERYCDICASKVK